MCYELTVSNRKQLEKASIRANSRKPRIEPVGYGYYKTFSTNPETPHVQYATGIERSKDGQGYDVCCSCPTKRAICLHVAACFGHFLMTERHQSDAGLPSFSGQVQEIKEICAATTATLAGYTEAQAQKDRADLFG